MELQGLNTIAFDLDGTLCYYEVSTQKAIAESLCRLECPIDLVGDLDQAAARYNELWYEEELVLDPGKTFRERAWARLLREHGVNDPALTHELAMEYTSIRVPGIRLFDDARDLLLDLKKAYQLGLLTNGPSDMQWQKIEILKITSMFDAIVVSGDVGIYKPDTRVFNLLLSRLGVMPQEALYVGDSHPMDVVGAKVAGMWSAWVRDKDEEQAAELTADIEVNRIGELREVLL